MYFEKKDVKFFDYQLDDNGNNYYHLVLSFPNSEELVTLKKELNKSPHLGVHAGMGKDLQHIKDFITKVESILGNSSDSPKNTNSDDTKRIADEMAMIAHELHQANHIKLLFG